MKRTQLAAQLIKPLLTLSFLFLFVFPALSQNRLSGTKSIPLGGGAGYSQVDWSINYRLEVVGGQGPYGNDKAVYIKFSNPKVSVALSAVYRSNGKTYTKAQAGVTSWPEQQQPTANFLLTVDVAYNGKTYTTTTTCTNSANPDCEDGFIAFTDNLGGTVNLSAFRVTVKEWGYNGGMDVELEKHLVAKAKKAAAAEKAQAAGSATTTTASNATQLSASNPNTHDATLQAYKDRQAQSQREADAAVSNLTGLTTTVIGNWAAEAQERRRERQEKAQREFEKEQAWKEQYQKEMDTYVRSLHEKATAGDVVAMRRLGEHLSGLTASEKAGLAWLEQATLMGDLRACMLLYRRIRSTELSRKWKAIAADQGDMEAVHDLINGYSDWYSEPDEKVKVMEWIQFGIQKGDLYAKRNLALIYKEGKLNTLDFKQYQNTAKAVALFEELAKSEDGEESYFALTSLYEMYKEGIGVEKDTKKASLLKAAAADVKDKYFLKKTYLIGTAVDYSKKIFYITKPLICYSSNKEMKSKKEPYEALKLLKEAVRFPGIGEFNVSSYHRETFVGAIHALENSIIFYEKSNYVIKEVEIDFTYDKREKVTLPF